MGKAFGRVEDYAADELVVALGHENLVCKALADVPVAIKGREEDGRLDLALLRLDEANLADVATRLRGDADLVRQTIDAKWAGKKPDGIELSALDLLLSKLRADFSSRDANWIPEMGKNRMISPVRGLPYISGCAEGDPSQLVDDPADPELGPWPAPRPAEPGRGAKVGLLDTQLYPHPWFAGGYQATGDDLLQIPGPDHKPPWSLDGHATFVAGLILSQAPGAQLIVRPVLDSLALGKTWDVAKIMADFVGSEVDILNLSFGCYTDDGHPPLVLAKAVNLVSPEILLVAAAGNHGDIEALRKAGQVTAPWTENLEDMTPVWPAAFAEVTAVGATHADFSPKAPWVDVTAPGVNVESTYVYGDVRLVDIPKGTKTFDGYARWKGTSFAAATVSGAVASKIGPGCPAREALKAVLADSERYAEIVKFEAS